MTAGRSPEPAPHDSGQRAADRPVPDQATSPGGRSRGVQVIAYTVVTLLGGVGALVLLGFSVARGDPTVVDVLLWGALAVLLLGSAVHQWWFAGSTADRSRHLHDDG